MSSYDKIVELVKVMELEGDKKREFIERELAKIEKKEREEKDIIEKDKDREERAAERAHQKQLKELETRQKELELEAAKTNPNIITQQSTTKPFISKFHKYNSKDETLENYLVQFEHIASTYNLNNEDMAKHLLANLSGEPLNIISTLTVDQKKDYAAVKTRLLEHFGKNSDFYRKLFRDTKLKKDGDFNRIIFDMRTNMIKWLELAKCDIKDPTQILDVTDLVFTFLKEKKIKTETELITNLNLFKDSHPGHTIDKRDLHQLAATATTSNNNNNDKYKWSNTKTCFNCGRRGHVKNQCKAPINYSYNYRYRSYTNFYNPNSYKHSNNYNNRPYRPHQSASPNERRNFTNSYQHNNYNRNNRQSRRDQFNYHTNNHPNNYNSGNRNNRNNSGNNTNTHREENVAYMQSNKSKIKVFPSYVNLKEVGSIRDSGATAIIVKASLVEPGQYLEDTVKVTYANIQKFDICKTAK
uniref:CCHC-type domain-containing protein n=1 Tax=Biomphalaria glabrata TaxID=6526 RepID=A0A2C9L3H3_BIOGL